jgi:hypothetical protein
MARSAQDKRVNSVQQPAWLAQTVSKPGAVPVAAKYARIASAASLLRQNSGRTVMTPRPGQQACALLATEPFTRRGSQAQSLAHLPPFQVLSLKRLKDIEPSILTETPRKQAEQPIRFVTADFRPRCVGFPAARSISRGTPLPATGRGWQPRWRSASRLSGLPKTNEIFRAYHRTLDTRLRRIL